MTEADKTYDYSRVELRMLAFKVAEAERQIMQGQRPAEVIRIEAYEECYLRMRCLLDAAQIDGASYNEDSPGLYEAVEKLEEWVTLLHEARTHWFEQVLAEDPATDGYDRKRHRLILATDTYQKLWYTPAYKRVLVLLFNQKISPGKAAEAIAELDLGFAPALPQVDDEA